MRLGEVNSVEFATAACFYEGSGMLERLDGVTTRCGIRMVQW